MSATSVRSSQLATVLRKLPIMRLTPIVTDTATIRAAMATPVRVIDRVTVRIPLVPVLRRLFNPMKVELPHEYRSGWRVEPDSVRAELSGPRNLVETVVPSQLRLRAIPSHPLVEDEVVPVQVTLPGDIRPHLRVESVDPPEVRLRRRQ